MADTYNNEQKSVIVYTAPWGTDWKTKIYLKDKLVRRCVKYFSQIKLAPGNEQMRWERHVDYQGSDPKLRQKMRIRQQCFSHQAVFATSLVYIWVSLPNHLFWSFPSKSNAKSYSGK